MENYYLSSKIDKHNPIVLLVIRIEMLLRCS